MKRERGLLTDSLLHSEEPSIRWKVMVQVLGEDPHSAKIRALQEDIRRSPRAKALLTGREHRFVREAKIYSKYRGAHWTLAALADIGYPVGDEALLPMRDQVADTLAVLHAAGRIQET